MRALLAAVVLFAATACGEASGPLRTSSDLAPVGPAEGCVVPEPGAAVTHRVSRGENLSVIAQEHYGDAALWREIARANPGVVRDDGGVDAGALLVIPFAGR